MVAPFVQMKSVCKSFHANQVLFDVDFDVHKGEVHALVGENGAGKSTLIKILAGVHNADSGEVLFDGTPVNLRTPREAFDHGISTIHQEFNLVPHLDVASNIFLGREMLRGKAVLQKKEMYKATEKLLSRVGASIFPGTHIRHLGVAEKQMVEICKALSLNAKLVIMDEPTAVLSPKEIDKLFEVIESIKADGISTLYISHRLEELPVIADRVTVLRDGRLIGSIPKDDIAKPLITKMMIGRDLTEQFPKVDRAIGEEVLVVNNITREGVLDDVSLTVRRGEILGISGLVGSGRTELARAIIGLDEIDSGTVLLEGKPLQVKSPQHTKKSGVVLVPEERKTEGLVLSLTVEENISLPYVERLAGGMVVRREHTRGNTETLIRKMNIRPADATKRVGNMSGGNQQKVAIAKWVYQDQRVIIFDEPTRGVDVGAKAEIYRIMLNLAKEGVAIIMISSELPEIIGMSDRVVVMREGRIAGELGKEELTEHKKMSLKF